MGSGLWRAKSFFSSDPKLPFKRLKPLKPLKRSDTCQWLCHTSGFWTLQTLHGCFRRSKTSHLLCGLWALRESDAPKPRTCQTVGSALCEPVGGVAQTVGSGLWRAKYFWSCVRVECAKCRRECDLPGVRATLCGDRACRVREMQARVQFAGCARNPLRRSRVSSARNAGESAICRLPAQPSAEIVRVECAKCRRECDSPGVRATLCGDRACRVREIQARVRFGGCLRNPLRRPCASSGEMQARGVEYLGSWEMSTGDFVVQL